MKYSIGSHCGFYHRYHIVWSIKCRYKVLQVASVCACATSAAWFAASGASISSRVPGLRISVHMFVSAPQKPAVGDLVRLMKGRSSHNVLREFPQLKTCHWGRWFWGRGSFLTTSGAITENIVFQYLEAHIAIPTGVSW